MTKKAYEAVSALREDFRAAVERWTEEHPYLPELQEALREEQGYSDYRIETSVVYNEALDDIGPSDEIEVVLIGDNPGKKEQLERNRRYLVGQSGRLAEAWFRQKLGLDFRRRVLILNKTPVHTPKTAELRMLLTLAGARRGRLAALLEESQRTMAGFAHLVHSALAGRSGGRCMLWISGLSELRPGGLFSPYRDELAKLYALARPGLRGSFLAFNHFSMNQFSIELGRKSDPGSSLRENLERIGAGNRERVFGF
jgi:hypothetical protein